MDKSCPPTGDPSLNTNPTIPDNTTTTTTTTNRDQFLRHLNKLSHKISKPSTSVAAPTATATAAAGRRFPSEAPANIRQPPPPPAPPLQQQPPVYNINKSDFRDVVQKLTGSPAHPPAASSSHAPPPTKPAATSRLHRIRPPPLSQLTVPPPPLLGGGGVQLNPHSPLPPLPTCHVAAAESPISAYMRFLHSSIPAVDSAGNPPPLDQLPPLPPLSPLWRLPSPKPLLSPTGSGSLGFPQLPISSPK